jgi:enoyl-CoA hydratase
LWHSLEAAYEETIMNLPSFETFQIHIDAPHVAIVTLATGKRGNPMGEKFWTEVSQLFDALSEHDNVRAVVLTSSDKDFSFGLDLMELAPMMPALRNGVMGRAAIERAGSRWQRALDRVAACDKPVVAAVNGWCIGAGLELISACDIRLCSEYTRFSLREVRVGMVADVGGLQRLPHLIPEGWMRQLAMTGEDLPAATALQIGLVNNVYADAAQTRAAAVALAHRIAANAPRVVAGVKQVMNARTAVSVQQSLKHALQINASLMQSEDFVEAIASSMQKRPAVFTGQ